MKLPKTFSGIGVAALPLLLPPGLSLLMNKNVRRKVSRVARVALLGAGVIATVPVALYVICKTSPRSTEMK